MKILLTGDLFHNYDKDILEATIELGHEVDFLFNNLHGPFNLLKNFHKKLAFGILPNKLGIHFFVKQNVKRYNKTIQRLTSMHNYDLIVFIGGRTIEQNQLAQIKSPKVLWFMDGIELNPHVKVKLSLFDYVFFFEPTDTTNYKSILNNKCSSLHLGFNPKRFYPINSSFKYDFSFIGSYYDVRNDLLSKIVKEDSKGLIIGDYHRSNNPIIKKLNTRKQIEIAEVNEIYNQSIFNLNIHHVQSKEGMNVRTFEILGSGNIQFVENQKAALELFKDGENILFYDSPEMLQKKFDYYSSKPELLERIRKNAYNVAIANHTWKNRMEEMILILKTEKVI